MLTDNSLGLITFINLFFVPILSLRIYCSRNSINWKIDLELIYRYVLYCVLNLPFTRLACTFLEKVLGIVCLIDSSKYTLVSILMAALLPLAVEIVEHYVHIDVNISYKEHTKDKKDELK